MSIPERITRLGKAYYGAVKDRIDSELSERQSAIDELNGGAASVEPINSTRRSVPPPPKSELPEVESLLRRAEEKIAAQRRDFDARRELTPAPALASQAPAVVASTTQSLASQPLSDHPLAADYYVLGVAVGSGLATVQAAYEDLSRRSDPARFPAGTTEQERAMRINARIQSAYSSLKKELEGPGSSAGSTENRFARLEF